MKLDEILNENIQKKWPHIEKVLLNNGEGIPGIVDDFRKQGWEAVKDIKYQQDSPSQDDYLYYLREYVRDYLVQTDPVASKSGGRRTPFVNHIVRWLMNDGLIFPEDIGTTRDLLTQYQRLKNNVGQEVPNLDTINKPAELRKLIMDFEGEPMGFDVVNDKIVGKQGPFTAFKIDTWEEGQPLFCDSGWCVKDRSYFEHYGPPFYLITRQKGQGQKREALLHIGAGHLMDVYDDELEFQHVEEMTPILDDIYANFLNYKVLYPSKFGSGDQTRRIQHARQKTDEYLQPIYHVLDGMPKTLELLDQMDIVNVTGQRDSRWSDNVEERIMTHPEALIDYMLLVYDSFGGDRKQEMEDAMLLHLANLMSENNVPHNLPVDDGDGEHVKRMPLLMKALIYYGNVFEEDPEAWPGLKDLVQWVGNSFENRTFLVNRCFAHAKKYGASLPMLNAMTAIFPGWLRERQEWYDDNGYEADVNAQLASLEDPSSGGFPQVSPYVHDGVRPE